ncbi:hypothetical protein EHQ52_02030 [Leptospira koniambonensis]|uniref:Uncharacterized protein n=1 Tax=Leptospira koniambonensis TaxID=2484950 RepID=A0A4R9JCD2_9LEPT|nr:hypothetical protein [Leptospira koniambonensis]TGL36679.1 hypothetical protein EHQ52_02030 [Leptospira koniambonensis]
MNIKKAHILFSLCLALGMGCQAGGDKSSADTFYDNIDYKGIRLFNLFDDYPSIKSGFQSLEPINFNLKLESSMTIPYREDIVGFLRVSGDLLLKPEAHVRQSLLRVHSLLDRIEKAPNNAFDVLQPWLESLRTYRRPVLRNMAPLSQTALKYMYTNYSKETMETKFKEVSAVLKDPEIRILFVELEDVLDKAINRNANAKQAITGLLQGMVDPSLISDRVMKEKLIQMIGALGKSFRQRAGFSDAKSSETVLKNLVVNLEKFYTAGGSVYSDPAFADYRDATYPTEFATVLSESFRYLRPMLGRGGNYTSDPNVILSLEMAKNFAKFDFASGITGVDHSLRELIRMDASGLDRADPANITSSPITALESLMFILTLSDTYGFRWENPADTSMMRLEPNGSGNGGPMTGGVLTVGDSIYSMKSAMTGNIGIKAFMNQSSADAAVFKNADATTPTALSIGINTPTLTLLEAPDPTIIPAANDTVYTKTIPFIMKLIRTVLISGGGPYYNKNRVDSNGNVLTLDGKLYRDSNGVDLIYKESWNTSEYRVKVSNTASGSCSGGTICKWVGPGGRETNAVVANNSFTPVAAGANASGAKGWSIPVWEIPKDNTTERAVNTDEEALYKNFQWLLHEKRMVAVIPLRASLGAGVPYKMAAFVTLIANGMTGLMNARPVLQDGSTCADRINAIWKIKNTFLKPGCASSTQPNFRQPGVPILQENYSDIPGDSMFYLEAWDYGTSGASSLTFNSLGDASVYSIFYPDPENSYGVIPQVIAANFAVMERLSFLTPDKVLPSGANVSYGKSVEEAWGQRNRLLPLILSLAWTLDDQANPGLNKNPFQILTGLSAALTRPLLARITDPEPNSGGRTIDVVKIVNSDSSVRSNSATEGEYFFRYLDPVSSKPVRSPLSILAENERRYQDGLLNLMSRTDLLSTFVQMLAEMGKPERASGALLTFQSIADLIGEIKLANESPTAVQFNLEAYLGEVRDMLAAFPDSRVANIYDPEWDRLGNWAVRLRDYFDPDSVYSLIPTLDFSMDMIIDNIPTNVQLTGIVDLLGGLTRDNTSTQDYLITNLLSVDTADLAQVSAPYGRSTVGVLMGIVKTGEFYSYLEADMRSPYSLKSIFKDAKKLLVSDMIQTQREDQSSLIYTAGVLMGIFADLTSTGKKQFPDGFVFYDRFNEDENSDTYWDRFVTVFTR